MFIRKSKYKALLESRDRWKELAKEVVTQNQELVNINEKINKNVGELIKVCKLLNEKLENKYTEEGK